MYIISNCSGYSQDNADLSLNNFNEEMNFVFGCKDNNSEPFYQVIDGRFFQSNLIIFETDILFNILRKEWKQVEDAVFVENNMNNDYNISNIRKQLIQILDMCRYSIQNNNCSLRSKLLKQLELFRISIKMWASMDKNLLIKLTSKSVQDDRLSAHYYFHMYLDLHWLILTLHYLCDIPLTIYEDILNDLIVLSHTIFIKQSEENVINTNAFVCNCVKKFWYFLQRFNEKIVQIKLSFKSFWETFNAVMKEYDEIFGLWLLLNVASLQGYDMNGMFLGPINTRVSNNFIFIENKLKSINSKITSPTETNNKLLLKCCKITDLLVNNWWEFETNLQPYQMLWEIFNRHINVTFDSDGTCESGNALVEIIYNISGDTNNSYNYFIYMLSKYLKRNLNQWPKIRGRIYCKFAARKIEELTSKGLYNVAVLFLSLANVLDIKEISEKFLVLLSDFKNEFQKSALMLNIYISLIILHVVKGIPIEPVCSRLLLFVQDLSNNRDDYYLVNLYVKGFDSILNMSTNFNLQQHIMIGTWVSKYIVNCQYNDLCYFLNTLLIHTKSISKSTAWPQWKQVLKLHVMPNLHSIATTSNAPSEIGQLAAIIDGNLSSDTLVLFTSDATSINVTSSFLIALLDETTDSVTISKDHQTAILQAWCRCCLLNSDMKIELTKALTKAGLLPFFISDSIPNNPLLYFIKKLPTMSNPLDLCEQCFERLDAWIGVYILNPTSESLIFQIYTAVALLIYHCSTFLYQKNRSNCFLSRLINLFLLPTDVLMGKAPHPYIIYAIQNTWHLFIKGIYSLDCSQDAYLERTLRYMIILYLPHFTNYNSFIIHCASNKKLIEFIFDKIAASFLSYASTSSEENTSKALKMISLTLEDPELCELVLRCTLENIFEVIMFRTNKTAGLDLIKRLLINEKYNSLQDCISNALTQVTSKHLAFNSNNYFEFVNILRGIMPDFVNNILPFIKEQIIKVEEMRGINYDHVLRQRFLKLETSFIK